MRVVLDTNVLVSGVFFGGLPNQILRAWRDKRIEMIVSPEILEEYRRIGEELSLERSNIDFRPILDFIVQHAEVVAAPSLPEQVCEDPDDDKFLACALASGSKLIVSGDKHLLK